MGLLNTTITQLMIKVKEYNFACVIVKVDVGPTYSSLATIKRSNETGWGTFT